jgi:hypothetical protein
MCRPSCCDHSGGQSAGIAAVAVILGAALIAAKISPIVTRIVRMALEVIRVAALTAGAVLAFAVAAWLTVMIVRGWLRRHDAQRRAIVQPIGTAARQHMAGGDRPGCLACGGSGTVLMLTGGDRYQPNVCPVCEPAEWAG